MKTTEDLQEAFAGESQANRKYLAFAKKADEEGFAEVNLAGRQFTITRQFLEDITEQSLLGDLRAMHKALLVMHSPNDEIVEIEHARHIFEAANYPKSFHSLDGADHLLSQPEDADYAAEVITTWAGRYIVGPDKELKA